MSAALPAFSPAEPAAGSPHLRVLHLIDSGGLYGAEIMLLTLMEEQRRLGARVMLGSIGRAGEPTKPLEGAALARQIEVKSLRMPSGYSIAGIRQVLACVRQERCDLIHGHGYKANVLIGALPRFLRRVPYLGTLHGWTGGGQMNAVRVYEAVERLALRRLDAIVAVSPAMLQIKAVAGLPRAKLRVIPNGIDVTTSPVGERAAQIEAFCAGGFTVGILGRLAPEKGHATLLKAVQILRAAGREIRVLVLGEGRLRIQLQALACELGLSEAVLFAGYQPNAAAYLSALSVCALPSSSEGLPMVLLEAMRALVPIVASRVGGIPEAVTDEQSALLVAAGEVDELAHAIARLQDEPALAQRLAQGARRRLEQEFSSAVMARRYLAAYAQLLGGGAGVPPGLERELGNVPAGE